MRKKSVRNYVKLVTAEKCSISPFLKKTFPPARPPPTETQKPKNKDFLQRLISKTKLNLLK